MVRAAAKNHAHVAVVVDPADYDPVLAEIVASGRRRRRDAPAPRPTRRSPRPPATTAPIVDWLDDTSGRSRATTPTCLTRCASRCERAQPLRYGENPHQRAAAVSLRTRLDGWWDTAVQHGGKELSYLNVYDTEAAWRLVHRFAGRRRASSSSTPTPAAWPSHRWPHWPRSIERANACDPGQRLRRHRGRQSHGDRGDGRGARPVFTEVVVAPGYETGRPDDADRQKAQPARAGQRRARPPCAPRRAARRRRPARPDRPTCVDVDRDAWSVVTEREPDRRAVDDLDAGLDGLRSRDSRTPSCSPHDRARRSASERGQHQPRRLGTDRGPTAGSSGRPAACAASDAFFPFRDGLDALADGRGDGGVQPGGSVRDDEVIAAADERGIAMVFTGERHFRH